MIAVSFVEETRDVSDLLLNRASVEPLFAASHHHSIAVPLHVPACAEFTHNDINMLKFRIQSWVTDASLQSVRNFEEFDVALLQFNAWPDHGVPTDLASFRRYIQAVDSAMSSAAPV
jgi:protein tyrosine phosphatase